MQRLGVHHVRCLSALILTGISSSSSMIYADNESLRDRLENRLHKVRDQWREWPKVSLGSDAACTRISFPIKSERAALNALTSSIGTYSKDHGPLRVYKSSGRESLVVLLPHNDGSIEIEPNKLTMYRDNAVTDQDLDAFVAAYSSVLMADYHTVGPVSKEYAAAKEKLELLGATLYEPGTNDLDWSCLAGYDDVKQQVEETLLLGLSNPEALDRVALQTRERFESNRPRAILFEGPPGTGKTTTAKIIAATANAPLVYLPVEAVMSKWFGESEKTLSQIFELCTEIGAIVFLDEIDSLATSRDSNMHEATRRILSVLLRTMEGFTKSTKQTIVLGASNRKQDLDVALRSRFDLTISFPLPGKKARGGIFSRYAKQLNSKEIEILANNSEGMAGRDIMDVCKQAERKWVSHCIRNKIEISTPPLNMYVTSLESRKLQMK